MSIQQHDHQRIMRMARVLPELKSMPRDDFVAWLEYNPRMYAAFRHFAMEALNKHRTRFSCYMIRERVRWYTNIEYGGEFKISNNVTPYMARLLAKDIPQLASIFSFKDVDCYPMGDTA